MNGGVRVVCAAAVAAMLAAAPAAGHVDVLPAESVVNEAHEYVIRVPTEREVATTGVRVTFPDSVVVVRFATTPGWNRRTVPAPDGGIRGVVYSGGAAVADEYVEFRLIATPIEVGTAVWRVQQTYADGVVKPWTLQPTPGADDEAETGLREPGVAPVTSFVATPSEAAAPAAANADDDSSPAAVWLGVIAIGIAAAALTAVGFLWSTRPMRLPPDDDPAAPPA